MVSTPRGAVAQPYARMNLKDLDLNLLLIFESLIRTRSTTQAGEELGMTQSGVSNGLKRLRLALGDPLFISTRQGMLPTQRGSEIAAAVQTGLDSIREGFEKSGFDPAATIRTFKLLVSDTAQAVLLPRLMKHLRACAPGIGLETIQPPAHLASEMMETGKIDLAVGFFSKFSAGYHRQILFEDRYVCLRSRHRGNISMEEYLDAAHGIYTPASGSHSLIEDHIDKVFSEHRRSRIIRMKLVHGLGISDSVAGTDLVVALPWSLAKYFAKDPAVDVVELPFPCPRVDISLQWHHHYQNDSGHGWIRRQIRELFTDSPEFPPEHVGEIYKG